MSEHDGRFSIVQRVRFGDLDANAHMNNVEFLRFFETARIDFMRSLVPDHVPTSPRDFGFIIAECHIAYRAPAFYDEGIRTFVWPSDLKRTSVTISFEMVSETDARLIAEGYGVLVGYDYQGDRVQRIPQALRERIDIVLARA